MATITPHAVANESHFYPALSSGSQISLVFFAHVDLLTLSAQAPAIRYTSINSSNNNVRKKIRFKYLALHKAGNHG